MKIVDVKFATELAQAKIDELALAAEDKFVIMPDQTQVTSKGWVFFFNTADFLRTGDPMYCLAGNGPILVTREGSIRLLPTATPWEDSIF